MATRWATSLCIVMTLSACLAAGDVKRALTAYPATRHYSPYQDDPPRSVWIPSDREHALALREIDKGQAPQSDATVALNGEPGAWERYWLAAYAALGFILAQAILIYWLFAERRKRRRSEDAALAHARTLIAEQEDDHARVARELHDDVTQRLALLAIDISRAEKAATDEPSRSAMRSIRHSLAQLSEDVHSLSYSLHPSILTELGLVEALRVECSHFTETCGVRVMLDADLARQIPQDIALCVFRIAQESLRNVARHAAASEVHISLSEQNPGLHIAIADNGIGFDPDQRRRTPRLGLASMRERTALLRGRFQINSRPGKGTVISAWLPLDQAKASLQR